MRNTPAIMASGLKPASHIGRTISPSVEAVIIARRRPARSE
jgi:hypothetical protein